MYIVYIPARCPFDVMTELLTVHAWELHHHMQANQDGRKPAPGKGQEELASAFKETCGRWTAEALQIFLLL